MYFANLSRISFFTSKVTCKPTLIFLTSHFPCRVSVQHHMRIVVLGTEWATVKRSSYMSTQLKISSGLSLEIQWWLCQGKRWRMAELVLICPHCSTEYTRQPFLKLTLLCQSGCKLSGQCLSLLTVYRIHPQVQVFDAVHFSVPLKFQELWSDKSYGRVWYLCGPEATKPVRTKEEQIFGWHFKLKPYTVMAKSIGAPQELLVFKQNTHTFESFFLIKCQTRIFSIAQHNRNNNWFPQM